MLLACVNENMPLPLSYKSGIIQSYFSCDKRKYLRSSCRSIVAERLYNHTDSSPIFAINELMNFVKFVSVV